jgi:phosphoserine phosphatase RsbU/P
MGGMTDPAPPPQAVPTPEPPAPPAQVRDLHLILTVARAMAVALDLDALLGLILDAARQVLRAERSTLFLYDAAAGELYSKIAHGTGEIRFPATAGLAGAAAQGRRLINIPDAYADPRFNPDVDRRTGYRTRCLLTVPLTDLDGHLVGVLQALNKHDGVFTAHDEHLAEALAAQIGVALQRARLMAHYVEKKQMENALAVARDIQQRLWPREAPRLPGYDVAGWCRPAEQTGGDCFDFVVLPGPRLALSVADASGHGIGAALMIAQTRAWLRALGAAAEPPAEVLTRANRWLCADALEGRFVTAFYGLLDPRANRLDYASAGHGPLAWYDAGRDAVTFTGATGLPLGTTEEADVEAAAAKEFGPGDLGVFLTDGFLEAEDPAGAAFGKARLGQVLRGHAGRPAAAIIQALAAAVEEFMAGGPQLDDWTAVVVKRRP